MTTFRLHAPETGLESECSNPDRDEHERINTFRFQSVLSSQKLLLRARGVPVKAGIVPGGLNNHRDFLCLRGHSANSRASLNPVTVTGHNSAETGAGWLRPLVNLRETLCDGSSLPWVVLDGFPLRSHSLRSRGKEKGEARGLRKGDKTTPSPRSGRACERIPKPDMDINYLIGLHKKAGLFTTVEDWNTDYGD